MAARKSLVGYRTERGGEDLRSVDIGWPTNVRHVAHVTFDRFHGFLWLPEELQPQVPRRVPSASENAFGVSIESMQCSYDPRGNSVPTILLLLQRRLYVQGGLQAEGIFRINAENSQEEHVRDQLNNGIVPDGIDVHCLAGLIKAWFRELPTGVLDSLTPEQVMQCQTEEGCARLVKLLPPTEAALLDWAANLMVDVVQEEHHNKMNVHNVAMVFAPNMAQMVDPLTALMHAVQMMNFLKTLIKKTLRERRESVLEEADSCLHLGSPKGQEKEQLFVSGEPLLEDPYCNFAEDGSTADDNIDRSRSSHEQAISEVTDCSPNELPCEAPPSSDDPIRGSNTASDSLKAGVQVNSRSVKLGQIGNFSSKRGGKKVNGQSVVRVSVLAEKSKGISILSRISSRVELVQDWW
uniref:Rho GTPase-activating protein gacA n=1 Tax=Anthurium amnicola TaxID=1678845 RepID=A0A1D1Y3G7_9ARAE